MLMFVVNDFVATEAKASVVAPLFDFLDTDDPSGESYPNLWTLNHTGSAPSAEECCDEIDKIFQQQDEEGNPVEVDERVAPFMRDWKSIVEELRDAISGPEDSLLISQ